MWSTFDTYFTPSILPGCFGGAVALIMVVLVRNLLKHTSCMSPYHWLSACVGHIVVFPHIVFIYERQPHKFRRLQILIESLHERKVLFLQLYLCGNDNVGHYRHDLTSCQPWEWRSSKWCQHGQPLFSLCGGLLLKWWVTWIHVLSWNTGHHGLLARTWLPT
jgi:hypothetical protein